ncbi:MAG: cyclophilin-like family protein [Candidatus Hodarchaeota archaeon]
MNEGDLCFWPPGRCFCIFFGPTPISTEHGKIRPTGPVNKIGRLCSNYKDKVFSDVLIGDGVRRHYFVVPSSSVARIQKIGEEPKRTKRSLKVTKFYILRLMQVLRNRLKELLTWRHHR